MRHGLTGLLLEGMWKASGRLRHVNLACARATWQACAVSGLAVHGWHLHRTSWALYHVQAHWLPAMRECHTEHPLTADPGCLLLSTLQCGRCL